MATLLIALETVGEAWETLDVATQSALTGWIARHGHGETESELLHTSVKAGLRYSPLTGSIAALALHDVTRQETVIYIVSEEEPVDMQVDGVVCKVRSEKALLAELWQGATLYDRFVTFDGRRFVVPFLLHRSAVCNVLPTVQLLEQRFLERQQNVLHVDLLDQLTFYGAMRKRPNLALWCRAFGIDYNEVDLSHFDNYTAGDRQQALVGATAVQVKAIAALYTCWRERYVHTEPGDIDF